jgi:hypothetical protein
LWSYGFMQSVHITTDVVNLNPDQGEVYNIMWSSLSVTFDRSVVFSGSSGFKTSDCNNVDGNCTCKTGWQGATCVEDVNECTDNLTICNTIPNSQCNNMNGSYKCNCEPSYILLTLNEPYK